MQENKKRAGQALLELCVIQPITRVACHTSETNSPVPSANMEL